MEEENQGLGKITEEKSLHLERNKRGKPVVEGTGSRYLLKKINQEL